MMTESSKGCPIEKSSWTPLVHLPSESLYLYEYFSYETQNGIEGSTDTEWSREAMKQTRRGNPLNLMIWQLGFEILNPLIHRSTPLYTLFTLVYIKR